MKPFKEFTWDRRSKNFLKLIILLLVMTYLGYMVDFSLGRIVRGIPSMGNLFKRMLRPNPNYIGEVWEKLIETIEIAAIASLVGIVIAMPLSIFVSKNIAPNKFLWQALNLVFAVFRTIPSLVWAAILVSIFSIGKFSGILALSITSVLVALKLFKDNIESIEENTINSTRAVGANNFQILKYCVFPTIVEQSFAIFFMVLEVNIRGATVLGLVGAGGIGQIMWRDLNHLRYDNLATLIIILLLTIFIIDFLSLTVRKRFKFKTIKFKSLKSMKNYNTFKNIFSLVLILALILLSFNAIGVNRERFRLGLDQGRLIVRRMARPDFSYGPKLLEGLRESIHIAIFATVLGSIWALIFTYLSAYNLHSNKYLVGIFKFFVNILRTFPSIITAIIFFRGVGPGPLAGVMALSIYTTGVLTKLYSELVESLPENLLDSVRVTGAGNIGIYSRAVIPQTMPNFISLALYRLESNIRASTVLGIIGAGGVGNALTININWRNWERVGLLILGISITVALIDIISNKIRKSYL